MHQLKGMNITSSKIIATTIIQSTSYSIATYPTPTYTSRQVAFIKSELFSAFDNGILGGNQGYVYVRSIGMSLFQAGWV